MLKLGLYISKVTENYNHHASPGPTKLGKTCDPSGNKIGFFCTVAS